MPIFRDSDLIEKHSDSNVRRKYSTDIKEAVRAVYSSASDNDTDADSITQRLKLDVELTVSDANIIFYVSGAIARSIVGVTKCDSCREVLINTSSELSAAPDINLEERWGPGVSWTALTVAVS